MRYWILWGVLILALAVPSYLIHEKEQILAEGTTILLQLAPRDPRSLIQGDYMTLNYSIANTLSRQISAPTADGKLLVKLDENGVARFERIHDANTPLSKDEHLLQFRKRGRSVRLATDAFFFQEGHADYYSSARYGELKVSTSGDAVLIGLRDAQFHRLQPPMKE